MTFLLSDIDHVGRLCGRGLSRRGKVRHSAFALREEKDEKELSVNWVECCYVSDSERNIEGCKARLRRLTGYSQYIAILNVGEIRGIKYNNKALDVVDTSRRSNCHCSITGLEIGPKCLELQKKLADLANKDSIHWLEVEP